MSGVSRRKRNYYSSPNNFGWGGLWSENIIII
jgi:hypothetical protein